MVSESNRRGTGIACGQLLVTEAAQTIWMYTGNLVQCRCLIFDGLLPLLYYMASASYSGID